MKPLGQKVWVTVPFANPDYEPEEVRRGLRHRGADGLRRALGRRSRPGRRPAGPDRQRGLVREEPGQGRQPSSIRPRWLIALGDYGYDWTLDKNGQGHQRTTPKCFTTRPRTPRDSEASGRLRRRRAEPDLWLHQRRRLQARGLVSSTQQPIFNEIKIGDDYRPRGYALWRMKLPEDPAVASAISASLTTPNKPAGRETDRTRHRRVLDFQQPGRGAACQLRRRPAGARYIETRPRQRP